MSLSNDQIVASLIAFYRSKGINVSYLLGDPLFQKMPTPDKIAAIQKYAKHLHQDSQLPDRNAKADYLTSGVAGGVAGALAGIGARGATLLATGFAKLPPATHFPNKPAMWKSWALTTGLSAAIGAGGSLLAAHARQDQNARSRLALQKQLELTAKDPSVLNAVGTLSVQGTSSQTDALRNKLVNVIADKISGAAEKYVQNGAQGAFHQMYEHYNAGVDPETFPEYAEYKAQVNKAWAEKTEKDNAANHKADMEREYYREEARQAFRNDYSANRSWTD